MFDDFSNYTILGLTIFFVFLCIYFVDNVTKENYREVVQDYRLCMKYNEGTLGEWKCRDKLTKALWKPESKDVK